MAKKVQVTSVTPKATVKATSKAKQASTRKLVGAIASVTPVGKAAKIAGTAAKAVKAKNTTRIPAAYAQTKRAKPIRTVTGKAEPIYKPKEDIDARLEAAFARSLKATKAIGGDPKKVKVTYNGRMIDYKGIRDEGK
jgi:hypothetical protein